MVKYSPTLLRSSIFPPLYSLALSATFDTIGHLIHKPLLFFKLSYHHIGLYLVVLMVKDLPANAVDLRDAGSTPGSFRSPGEGNGNPRQYSSLENSTERGGWWATVHGVTRVRPNWSVWALHSLLRRTAFLTFSFDFLCPTIKDQYIILYQFSQATLSSCLVLLPPAFCIAIPIIQNSGRTYPITP